ncbi:unknown [Parabacteroides sp. CAG:409]|nr:unknown [Parabacteroides sp. CAG:409]
MVVSGLTENRTLIFGMQNQHNSHYIISPSKLGASQMPV